MRGKPKPASLGDRAGQGGEQGNTRGPRFLVSQPERPGVERSPICGGPDAQCETEHRSRSKWAKERNGEAFRLRDKLESGVA
jgi:hypothetical protein